MKPLHILLVDDSASVGAFVSEYLRSNGHTVDFVLSGEEAVAAFQRRAPDFVLMDLVMPGIGGLEAIKRIRKIPTKVWVPIVVVTGSDDEGDVLTSFMAGADDYITKPIKPLVLDIRIHAMMRIASIQQSSMAIVEHVMEGVIRIDRAGRITAFNKAAETIFGYAPDEVLGKNVKMLMPSPFRENHDEYIGNYVATGVPKIIGKGREVTGLRKNGVLFPMHLGVTEATTPDDRFFIGLVRDLTVEHKLKSDLQESQRLMADFIENSPSVNFIKDREGRYNLVNRKYEELTGLIRQEVIGKTDSELFSPAVAEPYRLVDLSVMEHGRVVETEETFGAGDNKQYFLSVKFPVKNGEGKINGVCGISTNITPLKAFQRELEQISQLDELTSLFNRRHFRVLAEQELSRAVRYHDDVSVLMLDVDHFKAINDQYGHETGDDALKAVAQGFKNALREVDIIGRLGGEEFTALLPNTNLARAEEVAERIRASIAEITIQSLSGKEFACTVSIGVAALSEGEGAKKMDDLLREADFAMYEAKRSGRNRICRFTKPASC